MTSQYQSRISSLDRDIANLDRDIANESKKEADLIGKIAKAEYAANSSKNYATVRSKLREIERYSQQLATAKKKQADLSRKRTDKSRRLREYQTRQARADEQARKKAADEQRELMREREAHERRLSSQLRSRAQLAQSLSVQYSSNDNGSNINYDFFISHASEDKEDFVRQLAEALQSRGAAIWYDEITLDWGDKLRRKIDQGLANSRYGIVVLSEHFFKKEWPQRELDGLVALETASPNQKRVLPIWHKVSKDEVAKYSPTLADTIALNTSVYSSEEIADKMMALIQEENSHNLIEEQEIQTHLGRWLVESTPRGTNLEIPIRQEGEREIPFVGDAHE